jgi:hypothetical protein
MNGKRTLTLQSVFNDILSADYKRSYCILPLFHEDEQYGLLAVEVNTYELCVYDSLNGSISSTIKSMLLTGKLSGMNRKLEKANEQKTRFFINIAHEMKTRYCV